MAFLHFIVGLLWLSLACLPLWAEFLLVPFVVQLLICRPFSKLHAMALTALWPVLCLWLGFLLPMTVRREGEPVGHGLLWLWHYVFVRPTMSYCGAVLPLPALGERGFWIASAQLCLAGLLTLLVVWASYLMYRRGTGLYVVSYRLLLKYLRRIRIVSLSVAAVAMSVALLIVVASLFTGFINAFESSAVDVIGDVVIAAPSGVTFDRYRVFIERLAGSGIVEAATPTLTCDGLLHVGAGNVRGVTIWGIEPGSRMRVVKLKDALVRQRQMGGEPTFDVPGAPDKVGGYVGIGIVAHPDERTDKYDQPAILEQMVGQQVLVTTGTMSQSSDPAAEPRRVLVPFNIADVVFTGVYQLDQSVVYVPIGILQKALYPDAQGAPATSVNIKLKRGVDPEAAVTQIRGLWRSFAADELGWTPYLIAATRVATARQMQHQYVLEIRKQMGVLLLVFGVISLGVVVLVFCIFYMIVRLKRKDVAIMKSCGASSFSVAWIFLGFGVSVGVVGAALGVVFGYIITANINTIEGWIRTTFGLKLWQSSVYMFDKIPNVVDWDWAFLFAGLSIAAAALGALLPAALAARTRPVEVLRYE